tara:strand:+ start:57170 stop:57418 length:249 start_codon:yes stop_codon:yes gene_type:complete
MESGTAAAFSTMAPVWAIQLIRETVRRFCGMVGPAGRLTAEKQQLKPFGATLFGLDSFTIQADYRVKITPHDTHNDSTISRN